MKSEGRSEIWDCRNQDEQYTKMIPGRELKMSLFGFVYPDEYLDSAYEIDYAKYYEDGFRGVIFDIDNTLVPQDAPSDERSRKLLNDLKAMGYKVMLLSNNNETRVKMFLDSMDDLREEGAEQDPGKESAGGIAKLQYICKAAKPSKKGYIRAMEKMGTTVDNTLFVGDQLFTDVWGATRTGILTILVKPMDPHEEIQIVFKRKLEKPFLAGFKRKRKKQQGKK